MPRRCASGFRRRRYRTAYFPTQAEDSWWKTLSRGWRTVIAICDSDTDALLGFATFTQEVRSNIFGQVMKYAAAGGLLAARRADRLPPALHRHHTALAAGEQGGADPPPLAWRLGRAFDPIFIAQDAAGSGSLAKLQLLAFTGVVVAIVAQGWYATNTLPAFSTTVLALLGITSAGSVLSRAASGGALAAANRAWLVGRGVLSPDPRMPKLTDLFGTEGEIDITRLQALCFSAYVLIALLIVAPVDIPNFEVPDQFLYLMGLSQGVSPAQSGLEVPRLSAEVAGMIDEAEAMEPLASRSNDGPKARSERGRTGALRSECARSGAGSGRTRTSCGLCARRSSRRGRSGGCRPERGEHRAAVHLAQGDAGGGGHRLRPGGDGAGDAAGRGSAAAGRGRAGWRDRDRVAVRRTIRTSGRVDAAVLRGVLAELGGR